MARPVNPDSKYIMSVHKHHGYLYASTFERTLSADKKPIYVRKHWGKIDKEHRFVPSLEFICLDQAEKAKFRFPEGWDVTEALSTTIGPAPSTEPPVHEAFGKEYGPIWLLEGVAENLGIKKDLLKVFDGNQEMVDILLTLAFHNYLTGNQWDFVSQWQRVAKTPSSQNLTPSSITAFAKKLGKNYNKPFFELRSKRIKSGDLCSVDATTFSSYGVRLSDLRFGGDNKEGDKDKRQLKTIVVYNLSTHEPVAFISIQGNETDVRTVDEILEVIRQAGFPDVTIITDRGYASLANLQEAISKKKRMICCLKTDLTIVKGCISQIAEESRKAGKDPTEFMSFDPDEGLYYRQFKVEYRYKKPSGTKTSCDKILINIFVDSQTRAREIDRIRAKQMAQSAKLAAMVKANEPVEDTAALQAECTLFKITFKKYGGKTKVKDYELIEDAVQGLVDMAGYFCIATLNLKIGAMQALCGYGLRDEEEKSFHIYKTPMIARRPRAWNDESERGRQFIMFVGMIIINHIGHIYRTTDMRNRFLTPRHMVMEMSTIRYYHEEGHRDYISAFVGEHLEIAKTFDLEVPEKCLPSTERHNLHRVKFAIVKDPEA